MKCVLMNGARESRSLRDSRGANLVSFLGATKIIHLKEREYRRLEDRVLGAIVMRAGAFIPSRRDGKRATDFPRSVWPHVRRLLSPRRAAFLPRLNRNKPERDEFYQRDTRARDPRCVA